MVFSFIWSRLPSLFSEAAPAEQRPQESPKQAVTPKASKSGTPAEQRPQESPKQAVTPKASKSGTPGTGRARREAKRQQEESSDPSDFSLAYKQSEGKVLAMWTHRACRPGDVDAWVGLHEILAPKGRGSDQEDDDEDEQRHIVGSLEVSGRLRFKDIRSTKLDGELVFPLNARKLEDGDYVLALHNSGGAIGEGNLFLAVSEPFGVKDGMIRPATSGNKRVKK
jgi:hypothetical protein